MKKSLLIALALFLLLAISLVAVSPVAAFEGRHFRSFESIGQQKIESAEVTWTLIISTVSYNGNGIDLTFDVEGNPPTSLSTLAYGGWNGAYPMYCSFNSNKSVLICHIESGIRKHDSAYFELWGQPFTISVPERVPEEQPVPSQEIPSCQDDECPQ